MILLGEKGMPTVDLHGRGTVAYCWTGEGPETIVLVNGSVFNYHQWDKQALPMLRRGLGDGCRFLQYDYVGIGGSSAKNAPFKMLDLADELRDLLDALSVDRPHLLGISKGSLVGQAYLIRHPDRVQSFCGLGNPNLLSKDTEQVFSTFQERLDALEALKELWPQRIDRENYARIFNVVFVPSLLGKTYADLSLGERLRALLVRPMVYPALEGTFVQSMVDLYSYYVTGISEEEPAFAQALPEVRGVPILLLNGTADATTPVRMSRELAKLLPEAELSEFEGVTHMGPMMLRKQAEPIFDRYITFARREVSGGSTRDRG